MYRLSFLFLSLILFSIADSNAQRRATYESLLQRSDQPSSYLDNIYLPVDDSTAIFGAFFRLDYDFLPFLRKRPNVNPPSPEMEYYAPVRMGIEIFEGNIPDSRRGRQNATSIFRDNFRDTIWVAEFEETKSRLQHAQGLVQTNLRSGNYHYELQLSRGESVREIPSRRRDITIPDFRNFEKPTINLLNNLEVSGNRLTASLMNYGNSVLYGQDYNLLILLPNNRDNLKISVYQMQPGSETETRQNALAEIPISSENTFSGSGGSLTRNGENLRLSLDMNQSGETNIRYAYATIPNKEFENARYKVVVSREGSQQPVAERIVNSQWLDMPVSLYNLDVAISMMKFIVNDRELRRIGSGSTSDKERKFREFWAERDPTPETEFNELMDEYYSRIDYSYQNFSSMQTPGYETDQGRAYILYGPPRNVERRFPTNSPTREIWQYSGRTLIFEATSGFGDFRLVSES